MDLRDWACRVAEEKLSTSLPRRWQHVQGVANRSCVLRHVVGDDAELLEAAAVLHDVGYATGISATGFHPLDGAMYLARLGAPKRLVDLVAHHSCAAIEARLRGLASEMTAFEDEEGPVRDALWYCDVTTSPDGQPVSPYERFREIRERYGPDDVVSQFLDRASGELLAAVRRTEGRLAQSN